MSGGIQTSPTQGILARTYFGQDQTYFLKAVEEKTFFIGAQEWKTPAALIEDERNYALLTMLVPLCACKKPKKSDVQKLVRIVDEHYLHKLSNATPSDKVAYQKWVGD